MRVVQVDSGKFWRGSQKQIWLLSRELNRRRLTESWVVGRPSSPLVQRCKAEGLPTAEVAVRWEVDPIAVAAYLRLFRTLRPEIVTIHCSRALLPASWAARLAKVPLTVFWRWLDNPIRTVWQRWKYQQGYDAVITISQQVAKVLREGGIRLKPIYLTRVAIDPNEHPLYDRKEARNRLGVPDNGRPVIGTACFLVPRKRVDILLQAFQMLAASVPAHLVIIGDGPERGRLEKMASELGILPMTKFVGFREDAPALLTALDVFVLPSVREAGAVALLEAGMAKVPIVAAHAGGSPEYLQEGQSGLLFTPNDAKELAERLQFLLSHPDLARTLAEHHYAFVMQHCTIARIAQQVADIYQQLRQRR